MTTATSFLADSTPALIEFSLLESWLASACALQLPLHQIESQQQAKGREVQRLLLQAHLQHRGHGDVGPALQLQRPDGAALYSHRRLSNRSLTTVFGTVELVRMGYFRPGASSLFPLDRALALPARSFSYELQRRLVKAAVQNPFLESVQTIAELTGVAVSKRSLEEILPDAARDFDAFYQQRSVASAAGAILVAAVDGKGIPMVKPGGALPHARLTKGQKANKKRMATVATVFTKVAWVRTPQQVIESLFPTSRPASGEASPPPRPENKRVWASLLKGKTAVIQEVAEELERRDPLRSMTRLALTDGERALQIRVEQTLNVTLILDLMHVLEKTLESRLCLSCRGKPASRPLGDRPRLTNSVWRGRPSRQRHPPEHHQARSARPQTQNPEGRGQLPLSQPHSHALQRIPRQRLAHRQRPGRRRLQEPDQRSNGTLRNALDRANGRGHRPTSSHLSVRRF